MRTQEIFWRKRPEAIATTGTPPSTSSATTAFDSHRGGGRITPATLLASARAALRCGLGIKVIPGIDDQLRGGSRGAAQGADQQLAQIGGAGVGIDQRDARFARRGQRTGGEVRRVAKFAHRAHDALARRLAHGAVAVDDARNGHRRNLGQLRHFIDGDRAALATGRLLRLLQDVFLPAGCRYAVSRARDSARLPWIPSLHATGARHEADMVTVTVTAARLHNSGRVDACVCKRRGSACHDLAAGGPAASRRMRSRRRRLRPLAALPR